jgi:hypothetical protein
VSAEWHSSSGAIHRCIEARRDVLPFAGYSPPKSPPLTVVQSTAAERIATLPFAGFHRLPPPLTASHRGTAAERIATLPFAAFRRLSPPLTASHRGTAAERIATLPFAAFHRLSPPLAVVRPYCLQAARTRARAGWLSMAGPPARAAHDANVDYTPDERP